MSTSGPVKKAKEKLSHHCVLSFSVCRHSPVGSGKGRVTWEDCEIALRKAQHSWEIIWQWEAVLVMLRHVFRHRGYLPVYSWPSFPCLCHIHSVVINLASFQKRVFCVLINTISTGSFLILDNNWEILITVIIMLLGWGFSFCNYF